MPYFVRVKDPSTGHQFDVPETDPRIGKVFTALDSDRYPRARSPRPPKHYIPRIPASSATAVERDESDTSPASDTPAKDTTEAVETPESKPARANSRK